MNSIELYTPVRIVKMLRETHEYDEWKVNKRKPEIGEIGVYIDVLQAAGLPDLHVVEHTDSDGTTIWLSGFLIEELEASD